MLIHMREIMKTQLKTNLPAIDFELVDTLDNKVHLSDFLGKKFVVLVLNRGFVWPYCRRHMAQLRQDYCEFIALNSEIIALGPDGPNAFKRFWKENDIPFIGLADVRSRVADQYYQEYNLIKLGRMPSIFVIDKEGLIRYTHYAKAMNDIPENNEILQVLKQLLAEDDNG